MSSRENAIKRVLNGDAASFESLVREFQNPLFTLARNYLGGDSQALDLVQETFLAAYANIGRFDPAMGSFSTWLYAIARNKCLNVRRRACEHTGVEADLQAGGEDVERSCAERELFLQLDEALARLPDRERMVFVLAEIQEFSLAEVAELEGVPVGTVKSRLWRTKEKLRRLLEAHAR